MRQALATTENPSIDLNAIAAKSGASREIRAMVGAILDLAGDKYNGGKLLRALKDVNSLLLVSKVLASLKAEEATYPDNRKGFETHSAVNFELSLPPKQMKAADLIRDLLKSDADILISDCGHRVDCNGDAPLKSRVTLFKDSNNTARNRTCAPANANTTQDEDFQAAGLTFADDLQATFLCAGLVRKAQDAGLDLSKSSRSWGENQSKAVGKLDAAEVDLLVKLRDGEVGTHSGVLYVDDDGHLRSGCVYAFRDTPVWAFGGRAAAESKS